MRSVMSGGSGAHTRKCVEPPGCTSAPTAYRRRMSVMPRCSAVGRAEIMPNVRLKLTIEYAGTRYSGWQIQKNAKTIQGELERAIHEATRERQFELYGSGRTDAGVHALRQVAHLDIDTNLPPDTVMRRTNDALPSDIVL